MLTLVFIAKSGALFFAQFLLVSFKVIVTALFLGIVENRERTLVVVAAVGF